MNKIFLFRMMIFKCFLKGKQNTQLVKFMRPVKMFLQYQWVILGIGICLSIGHVVAITVISGSRMHEGMNRK